MIKAFARNLGAACLAAALTSVSASAQDLPKTHLKVLGAWGNLSQYKNFEQPFWSKEITQKSGGAITADITPFNEMGLKGPEIFRLMRLGVVDFGATVLGYVASDDPRNEAIDLAGIAPDIGTARQISDAYKPVYDKFYGEKFGIRVLGIWPYPAQVLYCNGEIKSLADIKGKKVRVAGTSLAEFIGSLGGTGVTMAFNEVVPAMQNKVVDCAVTGTLSGNSAKWHEVATHIHSLPLGWSQVMFAVNKRRWDQLDAKVRDFLQKEVAAFEDRVWAAVDEETRQGFDCNAGKPTCTIGTKANMTIVPTSAADRQTLKAALSEVVLPKWAARCGTACTEEWNSTVGEIVGVKAAAK